MSPRGNGRAVRLMMVASAGVAAIAGAACVSERATGTGVDASGCNIQLPSTAFGSAIVVMRDFNFTPSEVRVRPGTKVTWVNCGAPGTDSHTSTSNNPAWNSALIPPGATYTREFAAVGAFSYHCEVHAGMQGTVTVE